MRQTRDLGDAKEPALQHHNHGEEHQRFQERPSPAGKRKHLQQRRLPMQNARRAARLWGGPGVREHQRRTRGPGLPVRGRLRGEPLVTKRTVVVATAEISTAELPDQVAAVLAVILADAAFAGIPCEDEEDCGVGRAKHLRLVLKTALPGRARGNRPWERGGHLDAKTMGAAKMSELVGLDGLRRAVPRSDRVIVEAGDHCHRVEPQMAANVRIVEA